MLSPKVSFRATAVLGCLTFCPGFLRGTWHPPAQDATTQAAQPATTSTSVAPVATQSGQATPSAPPTTPGANLAVGKAAPETSITLSPAVGVRGKKYDLTLQSKDCIPDLGAKVGQGDNTKAQNEPTENKSTGGKLAPNKQAANERMASKPTERKPAANQPSESEPASKPTGGNEASKAETDRKWKVQAPNGSGIHAGDPTGSGKCFLIVPLTIDEDAPVGMVLLQVMSSDQTLLAKFEVMAVAPGPIPPGLPPQVDVMWGVLPRRIVRDNFGHFIADKYYAIELIIGNDSGYSLQISAIGFKLNAGTKRPDSKGDNRIEPNSSYRITRGTLDKGREVGARAYILGSIQALGPIAGGFSPLFRNTNHQLNYQTGVNIFSNPVEKGFELAVPDTTIKELARLDDQVFRDGTVVANNTQWRTLVFLPKEKLAAYINRRPKDTCSDIPDHKFPFLNNPLKCTSRASIDKVMTALGQLVLIGDTIQYLNRVRVEANPPGPVTPPPSELKIKYDTSAGKPPTTDEVKKGDVSVPISISGKNLKDASISLFDEKDKDALSITESKSVSDTQIDATIKVNQSKDAKARTYRLKVKSSDGSEIVNFDVVEPGTTDKPKDQEPKAQPPENSKDQPQTDKPNPKPEPKAKPNSSPKSQPPS